jgi:hypothetical protein
MSFRGFVGLSLFEFLNTAQRLPILDWEMSYSVQVHAYSRDTRPWDDDVPRTSNYIHPLSAPGSSDVDPLR